MTQISKRTALSRTKKMLVDEWSLSEEPLSDTSIRDKPPKGLGKGDNQVRALRGPIENEHFQDVSASVLPSNLVKAKTVAELRDKIWDGIPKSHRKP